MSALLSDALPAALQPPGETASAEVVHPDVRAREEEDRQGHDLHGVGTTAALLQLPALERLEDCLQEVRVAPGAGADAGAMRSTLSALQAAISQVLL